jgi:hypothetical protein
MLHNLINIIESQSSAQIVDKLKDAGIRRGDNRAYSQAKRLIFQGRFIDCERYDAMIKTVIRYVEG